MLSVNATVTESKPGSIKKLIEKMKRFSEKGVVAGFPRGQLNTPHYEPEKPEDGPGLSIIDVAIINNFGINVPRRDFMTPSTKKWKKFFDESLDKIKKELENETVDVDKFLNLMGQKGADIISQEIIALRTPPNSPVTIARKKSSNPLVDSGDMARSTTWQIRGNNE